MKEGILTQNGVHLKDHEYSTVRILLNAGYDVELIPPSKIKGLKMPDIMLLGVAWEMKSPEGNGKRTLQNAFQTAAHQSNSIIIDLRRCRLPEENAMKELEKHFSLSKRVRRMKVIKKDEIIVDFSK